MSRIRETACQIASSDVFPKPNLLGNPHQTVDLAGGFGNPAILPGSKLEVRLANNQKVSARHIWQGRARVIDVSKH
jgi:hypothetical protein